MSLVVLLTWVGLDGGPRRESAMDVHHDMPHGLEMLIAEDGLVGSSEAGSAQAFWDEHLTRRVLCDARVLIRLLELALMLHV